MATSARLIWITPHAEPLMVYCARVSSDNQRNPDYAGLLRTALKRKHWSVFETASMCLEIETSRAISAQILRHRSFHFQEFSQRYAVVQGIETVYPRRQDRKNRQSSHDDLSAETLAWWAHHTTLLREHILWFYRNALARDIAKESARFYLPMASTTRLYMAGTVRDWIFYITVRTEKGTQKEHRDVANLAKKVFCKTMPTLAKALGWIEEEVHEPLAAPTALARRNSAA